jgi:hypothetical protein
MEVSKPVKSTQKCMIRKYRGGLFSTFKTSYKSVKEYCARKTVNGSSPLKGMASIKIIFNTKLNTTNKSKIELGFLIVVIIGLIPKFICIIY